MRLKIFSAAILLLIAGATTSAQGDDTFRLENGLRVIVASDFSSPLCCAVLICSLPPGSDERKLADAALIRYLVWGGGSYAGIEVDSSKLRNLTLRFGGSADSYLTPDALIIYYSLPSEYLNSALQYLAVQVSDLKVTEETLRVARRKVESEYEASRVSSVLRQLIAELETYLWPDLSYGLKAFGSNAALAAADSESVIDTFNRVRNPSAWTLVVAGGVQAEDALQFARETLGTIPALEAMPEAAPQEVDYPRLGKRIRRQAQLSARHAVVAYRLPSARERDSTGLMLLAEYLRRSQGLKTILNELGDNDSPAFMDANLDLREKAGLLYLYASWRTETADEEVVLKLENLVTKIVDGDIDEAVLNAAEKALLIDYWTSRQSAQSYALWRARLISLGSVEDLFSEQLEELEREDLVRLAKENLTKENKLSMVTFSQ